jgi:hypothetical protein
MAVYTFFKSILDVPSFVAYIAKTLSSVSSASSVDGQSISVVFTAALSSAQQKTLTTLVQVYLDPTLAAYSTLNLLTYNRSSTALAASAVYTGLWEDVSQYQTVIVFVLASCSSTDAGLQVQFGYSKQQSDLISSFTVLNDSPLTLTLANPGRYVRIVYSNGAVAQDNFALQVRTSVARISNSDASSGNSERTASSDSALSSSLQSVALVQSSFVYSINPETVNTLVTGGGSVSQASGVAIVNANGTDSAAYLVTRRYVLASVGTVVRALAAVTFNAGTAGCTQLAGVGNENDGLFVGFQDLQFGVMSRRSAVDTWTFSSAFNVDKLDGTGPSSTALVPTNGNVYQIVYDSTGFGGVSFALCSIAGNVLPEAVVMHRVSFSGPTAASMRLHSMPLMASVQNTYQCWAAALCGCNQNTGTGCGGLHSTGHNYQCGNVPGHCQHCGAAAAWSFDEHNRRRRQCGLCCV